MGPYDENLDKESKIAGSKDAFVVPSALSLVYHKTSSASLLCCILLKIDSFFFMIHDGLLLQNGVLKRR